MKAIQIEEVESGDKSGKAIIICTFKDYIKNVEQVTANTVRCSASMCPAGTRIEFE